MKLNWKDLFFISLVAIVGMLATFKIVDLMFLKDKNNEIAVVGFLGTIISGVLSGAITLIGVRMTIEDNRRKEQMEKITIHLDGLEEIVGIITKILSQTYKHFDDEVNLRAVATNLYNEIKDNKLLIKSICIDYEIYLTIRDIREYAKFYMLKGINSTENDDNDGYQKIIESLYKSILKIESKQNKLLEYFK